MALMDIVAGAQGGTLFADAGKAVGVSAGEAETAMAALCPAIAHQLRAKSQDDADTFESLLDLLEDGADGGAGPLTDGEAIADGNAILDDIYGSREAAISAMRKLAGEIPETSLGKISAISATAVLAALARSHAAMPLAGAAPAAASGGGLLGTIVAELIKGAVQGAARSLTPKRRRRRSYTSYFGRKRKSRTTARKRRSTGTPSLEDIFSEILGSKRR